MQHRGEVIAQGLYGRPIRKLARGLRLLQALSALGVGISIDDFGTGYSSLLYLKRLPATEIKIDHAFVRDLENSSEDVVIVSAIVALGHALDMDIVAEGVETEAQLAYLHSRHVEFGQGWLFSRPLPRDEFVAFHQKRQQRYGAAREHMQNPRSVPIERESEQ